MPAAYAVQKLLDAVHYQDQLDAELMEYICSILTDPDPESSLEVLQELLCGAVPAFESRSSEEQTALVLKLLDDAKASESQQQQFTSTPLCSLEAVVAAFKQATIQSQQHEKACKDVTNTTASAAVNNGTRDCDARNHSTQDLGQLLAVCPAGTTQRFLTHLLNNTFSGDVQAAADWLLDCPDVIARQQSWENDQCERQEQQQQEEERRRQTKKQIVERFDLQVVPSGPLKPKRSVDILPAAKKGEQQAKVRYRDGKVVSCKGEKFIVEKIGEEWDGGSKGKVYTKGKRGVGYR